VVRSLFLEVRIPDVTESNEERRTSATGNRMKRRRLVAPDRWQSKMEGGSHNATDEEVAAGPAPRKGHYRKLGVRYVLTNPAKKEFQN